MEALVSYAFVENNKVSIIHKSSTIHYLKYLYKIFVKDLNASISFLKASVHFRAKRTNDFFSTVFAWRKDYVGKVETVESVSRKNELLTIILVFP